VAGAPTVALTTQQHQVPDSRVCRCIFPGTGYCLRTRTHAHTHTHTHSPSFLKGTTTNMSGQISAESLTFKRHVKKTATRTTSAFSTPATTKTVSASAPPARSSSSPSASSASASAVLASDRSRKRVHQRFVRVRRVASHLLLLSLSPHCPRILSRSLSLIHLYTAAIQD